MTVIKEYEYLIATTVFILGVEGLVDVADEVYEESEGLSSLPER